MLSKIAEIINNTKSKTLTGKLLPDNILPEKIVFSNTIWTKYNSKERAPKNVNSLLETLPDILTQRHTISWRKPKINKISKIVPPLR